MDITGSALVSPIQHARLNVNCMHSGTSHWFCQLLSQVLTIDMSAERVNHPTIFDIIENRQLQELCCWHTSKLSAERHQMHQVPAMANPLPEFPQFHDVPTK